MDERITEYSSRFLFCQRGLRYTLILQKWILKTSNNNKVSDFDVIKRKTVKSHKVFK